MVEYTNERKENYRPEDHEPIGGYPWGMRPNDWFTAYTAGMLLGGLVITGLFLSSLKQEDWKRFHRDRNESQEIATGRMIEGALVKLNLVSGKVPPQ